MKTLLKYQDITEKILGASFEVHKYLGNGFQEVIYQRALAWELGKKGLSYAREVDKVLVELKAISQLEDVHTAQILNYLKAYKLEVGLLINFGSKSLTFKRLVC